MNPQPEEELLLHHLGRKGVDGDESGVLPVPAGCRNMNFLVLQSFLVMEAEIGIGSGKSGSVARVSGAETKYRPEGSPGSGPRPPGVLVVRVGPWSRHHGAPGLWGTLVRPPGSGSLLQHQNFGIFLGFF